jgi:hypothetical protein
VVFSRRSVTPAFVRDVRRWIARNPGVRFVAVGYGLTARTARARARKAGWTRVRVIGDRRGNVTRRMLVRTVPSLVTAGKGGVRIVTPASGRRVEVARPLRRDRRPVLPADPRATSPSPGDPAPTTRARPKPAPGSPSSPAPSEPDARDVTAPVLSANWPANGTTLSGAREIEATASDRSGIARVELRRAGALVATERTRPYEFTLDPNGLPAGQHVFSLRAYDTAGNGATISRTYAIPAPSAPPPPPPPPTGDPSPPPAGAPPLWSDSFEGGWNKYGAGVDSAATAALKTTGGHGNNGRRLEITHPAGQYYGMGWYPRFSALGVGAMEDVHFRYYIRPWESYHFRLEAKIPGLGGGNFPTGCDAPDPSKGWSGRLQWGQVENHTKGRIQTYLYVGYPASNTGCGFKEFWQPGAELEAGKWACIEMRYRMNTPGQRDGVMQGWFNGQLKYDRRDIQFRNVSSLKADILAAVFYHGGTAAWQPLKTEYVSFDDLAISNGYIGCS